MSVIYMRMPAAEGQVIGVFVRGENVPNDAFNADWQSYQVFLRDGGVPLDFNPVALWDGASYVFDERKKTVWDTEQLVTRLRERQDDAKTALAISDTTIIRCAEKGVAVPDAWGEYRDELRKIIALKTITNEDELPILPSRPAFPEGT